MNRRKKGNTMKKGAQLIVETYWRNLSDRELVTAFGIKLDHAQAAGKPMTLTKQEAEIVLIRLNTLAGLR